MLADDVTIDQILTALSVIGSVQMDRPARNERTFLDTFDWRVHEAGWSLHHTRDRIGRRLALHDRASGRMRVSAVAETAPRFTADLPTGPLHRALAPVLDVRTLLPLATVRTESTTVRILDTETKTVLRVVVDHDAIADPAVPEPDLGRRARLVAVKGYEPWAKRAGAALAQHLGIEPGPDDLLERAVRATGRHPGDYSSKLRLTLDPALSTGEAATVILGTFLATIEVNRPGARADLDPEFLHDLRVAVRRTRATLKALASVVPEAIRQDVREGFTWLGRATGEARDLDVMVLDLSDAERDAAAQGSDAARELAPLHAHLRLRRAAAYEALDRDLGSPRCQGLLDLWRTALARPWPVPAAIEAGGEAGGETGGEGAIQAGGEAGGEGDGTEPVTGVARARVLAAHRRVTRRGRAITATSAAEDLHDLRKRAKELRYLLECFASLFSRRDVDPIVTELKALQDNLGRFQDHQVQADALRRFADEMVHGAGAPTATLMRMGRLAADQDRASEQARAEFAERFAAFDRAQNHRRFARLFAPAPTPAPAR